MSSIVNNNIDACRLVPEKQIKPTVKNYDTPTGNGEVTEKGVVNACEDCFSTHAYTSKVTTKHTEVVNNPVTHVHVHVDSDDDFMPTKPQ